MGGPGENSRYASSGPHFKSHGALYPVIGEHLVVLLYEQDFGNHELHYYKCLY